jgi:hypothetical protein
MPVFEIKNFTRYATEDLTAIFHAVEFQLASPAPGSVHRYTRRGDTTIPTVVTFKDYKPSRLFKTVSQWDNSARRMIRTPIRQHVKTPPGWKRSPDIRLVPPELIYIEPLSALAAGNFIPHEMLAALVARIASLYSETAPDLDKIVAASKVRILEKRVASVGATEKIRVARAAARNSWTSQNYGLVQLTKYTQDFRQTHLKALTRLRRAKVELTAAELAISAAADQFELAHKNLLDVLAAACKDDE